MLRPSTLVGAAAPLVCMIHCLLAPALVVAAPALAENRAVEAGLIAATAVLGVAVTFRGVRRHAQRRVWIPIALGLLLYAGALLGVPGERAEPAVVTAASVVVLAGIAWDARLRHRCACRECACPAGPRAG